MLGVAYLHRAGAVNGLYNRHPGELCLFPIRPEFSYPKGADSQKAIPHFLASLKLRPGDISTHFYRWPAPLLDKDGHTAEYLQLARKRGVKFDVGHGGGSFHFPVAEPLLYCADESIVGTVPAGIHHNA